MEFEVRHVAGIENCFVSLPLGLIQTLESTNRHRHLPSVLTLDLRSPSSNRHWTVAWSGATSSSSAIEVAPQFAECISLAEGTAVQVRAVSSVASATLVTIEPDTEDDWEVLELNAEQAEAAILKQVRIVHEAMRFPLWLHGRTIITFLVVSIDPKKGVVQLVPGTQVAVAPKRRKKEMNKQDAFMQSSLKVHNPRKALLRLQESEEKLFHKTDVEGVELGVVLTSVAFVHPETAKKLSVDSLQLFALVPRVLSKANTKSSESNGIRIRSTSIPKEADNGIVADKKESRQAIVHLLFSDSVAKGHIMIAQSLRLYLRAALHSWVYLKGCNTDGKEDFSFLTLSPCYFKMHGRDKAVDKIGIEDFDGIKIRKPGDMFSKPSFGNFIETMDWSMHDKIVATLSRVSSSKSDGETDFQTDDRTGLSRLLQAWFLAQLNAVASSSGVEVKSLVLGKETLLHFQVKGSDLETEGKVMVQGSSNSNGYLDKKVNPGDVLVEFLYVLTISGEFAHERKLSAYNLAFDKFKPGELGCVELLRKLKFGDPISLYSQEGTIAKTFGSNLSKLSWMGPTVSDVFNRMNVLLSPASGVWFSTYNLPLPGHVLIYGPHGSGKTVLARSVAKSLEEHEDLLAHIVFIGCSALALEKASTIRQALSGYLSEALDHAPSVVVFDDLDSLVSSSSDMEGSQPSTSVVALTKFLTDVIDEYGEKRKSSCGIGPIAFVACVQTLESIPQSLRSSGRFDFHVQLPAPAASERAAILKHEIQRRSLQCCDEILLDVASKCDGYDAYDLEILVDRTVHAAIGRFLPSHASSDNDDIPTLVRNDFTHAMHEFLPVAMRDITKSAPDSGHSGWDDVGGLSDIRNAIKEMIEFPSRFPNIFSKSPLRLRSNVLLYGPPGCGKTHIVGAAAAACSLRFISVKGPELLNKYIGASEQAVRDIFSKAAAAAPCLLFFDEFDSIAPKRGHDNTGVTDRVVNQFLTELDGVEVLTGVFVFAATSRPDLLDAALLRPGRLDRLLFCDFPSRQERLDILKVLSRKLPLADDVELDSVAYMTEGFSGADLQALLSDAQLAAVHEHLSNSSSNQPGKMPVITDAILKSITSKARPSISEAEKRRLYSIYSQFIDSKKSVAAQTRDAKGKRATLA